MRSSEALPRDHRVRAIAPSTAPCRRQARRCRQPLAVTGNRDGRGEAQAADIGSPAAEALRRSNPHRPIRKVPTSSNVDGSRMVASSRSRSWEPLRPGSPLVQLKGMTCVALSAVKVPIANFAPRPRPVRAERHAIASARGREAREACATRVVSPLKLVDLAEQQVGDGQRQKLSTLNSAVARQQIPLRRREAVEGIAARTEGIARSDPPQFAR